MGKVEAKGTCQFCGKEISKAGLINHQKACSENPANKPAEVEETKVANKVEETKEVATVEQVKPELVTVKLRESINCYIGDRYYRFNAGHTYEVTHTVKERLMGAGLLEAI